jgi:hypothetical protein
VIAGSIRPSDPGPGNGSDGGRPTILLDDERDGSPAYPPDGALLRLFATCLRSQLYMAYAVPGALTDNPDKNNRQGSSITEDREKSSSSTFPKQALPSSGKAQAAQTSKVGNGAKAGKAAKGGNGSDANSDTDTRASAGKVEDAGHPSADNAERETETVTVKILPEGSLHEVPAGPKALEAATAILEWAVKGIMAGDFPMRPHAEKCAHCGFRKVCRGEAESFSNKTAPPALHVPGGELMPPAYLLFNGEDS